MNAVLTSVLGVVCAGSVIAFLAWPGARGGQPLPGADAGLAAAGATALGEILKGEIAAREKLAAEVAALRAELAALALGRGLGSEGADARDSAALPPRAEAAGGPEEDEGRRAGPRARGRERGDRREGRGAEPVFDESRVIEAGLSADDATRLRERHDRAQLELLALRDQAVREGVDGSPELRQATRNVELELRKDLGDELYDFMLFGAGRANRVLVRDVFRGSAAEAAGVQPGDVIVSYGGQRVFSPRELRGLTTRGQRGQPTSMQVQRGGQLLDLSLPAGPIGAPVRRARRAPLERP